MRIRRSARMSPHELRLCLAAPRPFDGFRSRFSSVAGGRLHIRERVGTPIPDAPVSAAPAWLLLHGLAVSHRYLMPTAAALPGRVHVPDLPGFGLSPRTKRVYDTVEHARSVIKWMETDHIGPAYVLGNSFGCQVAAEIAVRRPDLVAALVLVGPTVDPAAPTFGGQIARWCRDLRHEDPRQARIIAADVRDGGLRRVWRTLRHSVHHHIGRRLPLVQAPVLVLRGEHDPLVPPDWARQSAMLAPHGHVVTIPRAAHNAVTTAGPAVAAEAVAFTAAAAYR
jgi:pimeloyl-ACP methyl ester carboxylesterase